MIGGHYHVGSLKFWEPKSINSTLENLVAHRVLLLLDILPKAVSLGMTDADEPLKVYFYYPIQIIVAN